MTREMEHDVIVVGGGAAGCVVAARLAADGARSVLLVEAGPDLRADLPDGLRDGWRLTPHQDWGFASEPDAYGVVHPLRRSKLLGGTSWLTRFAVRGSPADFDGWAALGNAGWGFDDVLPSFNRLEADADYGQQPWHGDAGPMPVRRYLDLERSDISATTVRAIEASGIPAIDDHNRPGAVGVGPMPMSSIGGLRVTAADAYLPLGRTPPKLEIRADSQVSDLVLDRTRATGTRLVDGTVLRAECVILCAGTYGSPPILLRSGVGPADHLRAIGIPVRLQLDGVGSNLADHPGVEVEVAYRGPASDKPVLHTIATFHSASAPESGPPDLMLWFADPDGDPPSWSIEAVLLKPRSRGSVRLRSADPTDPPRIELPGLSEPTDLERLTEGYLRAHAVASMPELQRRYAEPVPAPPHGDELQRRVRGTAYSVPHVVGTCSMGGKPDDGAVVDASGQVHGLEGLYVVDASIMPDVPSGFTHLSTIMIAERLSEVIAERLRAPVRPP